jgi:hypothetical protein
MRKIYWILMPILVFSLFFGSVGVVSADDTTPPAPEEITSQNPVIAYLASITGETADQIIAYQKDGYGLGNIAKAYYLLNFVVLGDDVVLPGDGSLLAILEQSKLTGWGNLYKELGLNPGEKRGLGWLFKQNLTVSDDNEIVKPLKPIKIKTDKNSPPDHANNDKVKEDKIKDKENKD